MGFVTDTDCLTVSAQIKVEDIERDLDQNDLKDLKDTKLVEADA